MSNARRFGGAGIRRGIRARGNAGGAEWSPADLSPEGWWRADLGVTEASLEISAWANQGTEPSLDLTQSSAALKPDLVAADANFNGQATIYGDGGDVLETAATAAWELAETDSMVTVLVYRAATAGNFTQLATEDSASGGMFFRIRGGGTGSGGVYDSAGSSLFSAAPSISAALQTYAAASVYHGAAAPTSDNLAYWLDGVAGSTSALNRGTVRPPASGTKKMLVGALTPAGAGGMNGHLAEVLYIKRTLSADEDASLAAYINERYGLSVPGVTR